MQRVNWQANKRRSWLFLTIAVLVVAIDQISKLWVRGNLTVGESLPETGLWRLTYLQNTGSAFGLLANQAFLLTLIGLVGLFVILLSYRYFSPMTVLGSSALGLIFGGAVGNLIDRFCFGYVTDFIDICLWHDFHWPAFNLADSAITIGTLAFVYFLTTLIKKQNGYGSGTRN
jgi:signal peptidase II